MKSIAIIVLPFAIIYLGAVIVSLEYNPLDWSLAVQIVAGIFTMAHCALIVYAIYCLKSIKTD